MASESDPVLIHRVETLERRTDRHGGKEMLDNLTNTMTGLEQSHPSKPTCATFESDAREPILAHPLAAWCGRGSNRQHWTHGGDLMTYYCTTSDVGSRLGLDSAQRSRASTRLTSAIRRATIEIDLMFRDFGRDVPSDHIAETTLNGAISAGATTITLTSASSFSTAGNGNIDGDSFKWTGK